MWNIYGTAEKRNFALMIFHYGRLNYIACATGCQRYKHFHVKTLTYILEL